jgi:hypothetical protein
MRRFSGIKNICDERDEIEIAKNMWLRASDQILSKSPNLMYDPPEVGNTATAGNCESLCWPHHDGQARLADSPRYDKNVLAYCASLHEG